VQHFDDLWGDAPGLREDLRGLWVHDSHALIFTDHGGAVAQDGDHGHADFAIGDERFPVIDAEPHAEVEAVGVVVYQYLAIVCAH